ncbi:hypothetical protein FBY14_12452 [Azospirillum brasilense]|nr:hypothetical protein FBY14_12452 [Azospirillum brasilense]
MTHLTDADAKPLDGFITPADASTVAEKPAGPFSTCVPLDRITVRLRGAFLDQGTNHGRTLVGEYLTQARLHFVVVKPPGAGGLASTVLGPIDPSDVETITLDQSAEDVMRDRYERKHGDPFLSWTPATRDEFERALYELADEVSRLRDEGDTARDARDWDRERTANRRRRQIVVQFDELAERIRLAKTKRRYVLADAGMMRHHGQRFDPLRDCDGPLAAQNFVRPLPLDFHPDPTERQDRAARRQERHQLDAHAAELDLMRQRLKAAGIEARRPLHFDHLLIKVDTSSGPALWNIDIGADGRPVVTWGESGKAGRAATTRKRLSQKGEVVTALRQLCAERARELRAQEFARPLAIGDEFDHHSYRWRLSVIKPDGAVHADNVNSGSVMHKTIWLSVEDFQRSTGRRIAPPAPPPAAPAMIGHNGGPSLDDDQDAASPLDAERARLAALEAAAIHPRPEITDAAQAHPATRPLVDALSSARHRAHSVAEDLARAQFPHRAGNCCFKIGGSKETGALRNAYTAACADEDAKRHPMTAKLRRQIRGRLAHAAASLRKTLARQGVPVARPAYETQRRTSAGIVWEPCEIVTTADHGHVVRFRDGTELPRPAAAVRRAV